MIATSVGDRICCCSCRWRAAPLAAFRATACRRAQCRGAGLTFLAALSLLFVTAPAPSPYLLVDDLNIVFIVLSTFIGFTTSVFSASYVAHELEIGRLKPRICASITPCIRS